MTTEDVGQEAVAGQRTRVQQRPRLEPPPKPLLRSQTAASTGALTLGEAFAVALAMTDEPRRTGAAKEDQE
jgi:hypothetical protein